MIRINILRSTIAQALAEKPASASKVSRPLRKSASQGVEEEERGGAGGHGGHVPPVAGGARVEQGRDAFEPGRGDDGRRPLDPKLVPRRGELDPRRQPRHREQRGRDHETGERPPEDPPRQLGPDRVEQKVREEAARQHGAVKRLAPVPHRSDELDDRQQRPDHGDELQESDHRIDDLPNLDFIGGRALQTSRQVNLYGDPGPVARGRSPRAGSDGADPVHWDRRNGRIRRSQREARS